MIIRGGNLVTPEGILPADLAIEGSSIAAIGRDLGGAADEIDATGLTIFPGLIDVHVPVTLDVVAAALKAGRCFLDTWRPA